MREPLRGAVDLACLDHRRGGDRAVDPAFRPHRRLPADDVLGVATATVSIVAFAITLSFESRACPNIYANDCHGRGTLALLQWMTYVGPVLIASFALGPIHGRSWTSYLALPFAGLIGLGIAAAPSAIGDANIDGDVLLAYMIGWPLFLVPLIIAAVAGSNSDAARSEDRRRGRRPALFRVAGIEVVGSSRSADGRCPSEAGPRMGEGPGRGARGLLCRREGLHPYFGSCRGVVRSTRVAVL